MLAPVLPTSARHRMENGFQKDSTAERLCRLDANFARCSCALYAGTRASDAQRMLFWVLRTTLFLASCSGCGLFVDRKAGAGEAELQGAVGSSSASEAGKRGLGAVRLGYTRATGSKASTTRMKWHWATVASGARSTTHVRRIATTACPELSSERWRSVAELSKV